MRRRRPVVVVDDDSDVRRLVGEIVGDEGFPCVVAADGAEALRVLDDGQLPSLVLLDIRMPGMDGPAFARTLRSRLQHVPLVVMTGLAQPDREADRCNADAVLAKPFDDMALRRLVRHFAR